MKTIAIALCAAVLAGAGGLAISKAGDSPVATSAASTQTGMSGPGGGGQAGGRPDLSALAEDLGVSEAKLQKAMTGARPSGGGASDPSDMAATLAESLGLSTATVQKALEANAPSGGTGGGGTPPSGQTKS